MSQTQYKNLMSNLLNEKHALAKLRAELEKRKGKLCRSCKGFGHLARNCRNKNEEGKGAITPQNKFEILSSRVMQCGVEERIVKNVRMEAVKYFKYREEGHKYRWYPMWKKEKRVVRPEKEKAHQRERRPARPKKGKAQERERRLRRVKEEEAARVVKPQKAQQGE